MADSREATCHCGQLRLVTSGEPFAVSICHCLACQRRTGSAFGVQAAFKAGQVHVTGRYGNFSRPDLVVVSAGSFADPSFPPPTESGYDSRRHRWVGLPESIVRHAPELCCESLAGRPHDAIEHLEQAIAGWEGCRDMAKHDSDFDPVRNEPGFVELTQHSSGAAAVRETAV